jgi:hypothetical protein
MSSAADPRSEDTTVRGSEAEEAPEPGQKRAGAGRGNARNKVRVGRDLADVPPVRDETGEKVSEMFGSFLEQYVVLPPLFRLVCTLAPLPPCPDSLI